MMTSDACASNLPGQKHLGSTCLHDVHYLTAYAAAASTYRILWTDANLARLFKTSYKEIKQT